MSAPWTALQLSLWVGLACVVFGFPFALASAWILARKTFFGKSVFNAFLFLPLVLPPAVTGFALLELFGRSSPVGHFLAEIGIPLSFSFLGAVTASLVVGFPLYVLMLRTSLETLDRRIEEVAWCAGISPTKTFWTITLPLLWPGLLSSMVVVFARAMGEFGATIILAGNIAGETQTLSLALYSLLDRPDSARACAMLVAMSIGVALVAVLLYERLLNKYLRRVEGA